MLLRPETLERYVRLARPILVSVAKNGKPITYEELKDKMGGGPGRGYIGEVLEEVSDREYGNHRPLLSALVVHKADGRPGNGFWGLKVLPPSLKDASIEEKVARWEEERRKCWEYWQGHDP
jgi:hypothetical protein